MSLERLASPSAMAVSRTEAKVFLRIDHDDEDGLIDSQIAAATAQIEAAAALALIRQRFVERIGAGRPADMFGGFCLSVRPVMAVLAVRIVEADGRLRDLGAEAFRVADGFSARVSFPAGPPILVGGAELEIEFEAGFGEMAAEVPAELREAVLQLVRELYERGENNSAQGAWRRLIAPYRPVRL